VTINLARRVEMLPAESRKTILSAEELRRVLGSLEGPPRDGTGVLTAEYLRICNDTRAAALRDPVLHGGLE
jgi:hypothetical protein